MSSNDTAAATVSIIPFDPHAAESPSQRVVTGIAAVLETDPIELTPLYEVVDPDALDALFAHATRERAGTHECWFVYEGFDVCVSSEGTIRVLTDEQ